MASLSVPESFENSDNFYSETGFQYNPKINHTETGNLNLCRYFMQGYCSRGDRCHYAHVTNLAQIQSRNQPFNSYPLNANQTQYHQKYPTSSTTRSRKSTEEDACSMLTRMNTGRLEDISGQVYALSKDQFGCRYLQKQIEDHCQLALDHFYPEILPHISELMTDPFGNYLCQKLVEFCTNEQRAEIIAIILPVLRPICLNMHGTRAAQKLIEFVNTQDQVLKIN